MSAQRSIGGRLWRGLLQNPVPILFGVLCLIGIVAAKIPAGFLLNEIVTRLSRNLFLVLSLIVPVVAGMGLNFGIVIGAMCGQIGLLIVENGEVHGIGALALAMLLSLPLSIGSGVLIGRLLNKAKGREMITGMILGFFANGVYQSLFLLLTGPVIPIRNPRMLLTNGVGLKNTVDLLGTKNQLDNLLRPALQLANGRVFLPVVTFLVVALVCLFLRWYLRTKSGQDLRAVGQDMKVAEIAGVPVDQARIRAIVLSTVLGGLGHIVFLQNIGTMNTYQSHEQVGPYAIAALLVGGATVARATIWHALLGTALFHTLFYVAPTAGAALFGDKQVGEYFREFIGYAVIGVTLALHAWKAKRKD